MARGGSLLRYVFSNHGVLFKVSISCVLVIETEGTTHVRPDCGWKDNNEIYLKQVRLDVGWIQLTQIDVQ